MRDRKVCLGVPAIALPAPTSYPRTAVVSPPPEDKAVPLARMRTVVQTFINSSSRSGNLLVTGIVRVDSDCSR
jgi:hypothetical protein